MARGIHGTRLESPLYCHLAIVIVIESDGGAGQASRLPHYGLTQSRDEPGIPAFVDLCRLYSRFT